MIVRGSTQATNRLRYRGEWWNNMQKQGGKTWWTDKDSGAGWANVFLKVYNSTEAEHAVHRSEVDGMQEASDSLRHERQPKNCKDFIGVSVYFWEPLQSHVRLWNLQRFNTDGWWDQGSDWLFWWSRLDQQRKSSISRRSIEVLCVYQRFWSKERTEWKREVLWGC